jgi:hypothetical protein
MVEAFIEEGISHHGDQETEIEYRKRSGQAIVSKHISPVMYFLHRGLTF